MDLGSGHLGAMCKLRRVAFRLRPMFLAGAVRVQRSVIGDLPGGRDQGSAILARCSFIFDQAKGKGFWVENRGPR